MLDQDACIHKRHAAGTPRRTKGAQRDQICLQRRSSQARHSQDAIKCTRASVEIDRFEQSPLRFSESAEPGSLQSYADMGASGSPNLGSPAYHIPQERRRPHWLMGCICLQFCAKDRRFARRLTHRNRKGSLWKRNFILCSAQAMGILVAIWAHCKEISKHVRAPCDFGIGVPLRKPAPAPLSGRVMPADPHGALAHPDRPPVQRISRFL
jgi:hypothetical protein